MRDRANIQNLSEAEMPKCHFTFLLQEKKMRPMLFTKETLATPSLLHTHDSLVTK